MSRAQKLASSFAVISLVSAGVCFAESKGEGTERDLTKTVLGAMKPHLVDPNSDALTQLRIERRNAALETLQAEATLFMFGRGTANETINAAERALAAQLASPADEKLKVLEAHVEFARKLEEIATERHTKGILDAAARRLTKYWRLEVETRHEEAVRATKDRT